MHTTIPFWSAEGVRAVFVSRYLALKLPILFIIYNIIPLPTVINFNYYYCYCRAVVRAEILIVKPINISNTYRIPMFPFLLDYESIGIRTNTETLTCLRHVHDRYTSYVSFVIRHY